MEKKKNKGYIITIIILAVMLVGSIGYIFYSNIVANNDTEKKQNNTNNEKIINKNNSRELTELEKATIKDNIENFYNIYFSKYYPITDIKSIPNQELLRIALYNTEEKTVDSLNSFVSKYFGNTITLKHEDYICPLENIALYKYDDTNKGYILSPEHPGHGGSSVIMESKSLIIDGKYENEVYTVHVKNLYGPYCSVCGPIDAYYSSFIDSKNGQNPIIKVDIEDENFVLTDEVIKTYSDKIPTTTYKFKLDSDGHFYLISVN